ncbi:ABC transporter permease [Pseudosulfitobacter pseudonitzschiae]|uniref:ABC transporter permease n=1 Tax=Pseudosulfitobacter pseudonitzschiae TaxID=1402135 RepID=A0A073JEK7_9RHOB|nr:ABC transporter permease [Pseudosulfitobacter pseudonitzschiae]KEJ96157.1 ABC transporter permease [Pseudosulfitobacter pseudonitzschiae]MBM1815057.1 ABC transporter permease [Pseudosulfitobacter pseudonitzschiae]MBM1832048.1 ABC transporter permease [Pseudosulfitobacter pseudonitzschiae]MBM1836916.1 ABC transporter permease [Pseudosulfitobacter pseudonitzschiae]MBM1841762.1 ABC transporter permease [Pseudosulfitobacter pseudonitzschiae]
MSTFMPMLYSAWDSDIAYSFRKSRVAVISTLLLLAMFLAAIFAPHLAPQNPFDIAELSLFDSELPPAWAEGGNPAYLLGTDTQARDVLSSIMYGMRISLVVGFASVILAAVLGVTLGLLGGFLGGIVDAVLMRIADVLLSFPPILVALLINGVLRGALPQSAQADSALIVLILSIGLTNWVQYARTVRGSTMVERRKEYIEAARTLGTGSVAIMVRHILPNVLGPVLVIATINLGMAVLTEATLSFLGVGMPPTQPSLGTLIQIGNEFLFSGIWWVVVFPAVALAVLVLAVNLLGDWLRDALNPKLR